MFSLFLSCGAGYQRRVALPRLQQGAFVTPLLLGVRREPTPVPPNSQRKRPCGKAILSEASSDVPTRIPFELFVCWNPHGNFWVNTPSSLRVILYFFPSAGYSVSGVTSHCAGAFSLNEQFPSPPPPPLCELILASPTFDNVFPRSFHGYVDYPACTWPDAANQRCCFFLVQPEGRWSAHFSCCRVNPLLFFLFFLGPKRFDTF